MLKNILDVKPSHVFITDLRTLIADADTLVKFLPILVCSDIDHHPAGCSSLPSVISWHILKFFDRWFATPQPYKNSFCIFPILTAIMSFNLLFFSLAVVLAFLAFTRRKKSVLPLPPGPPKLPLIGNLFNLPSQCEWIYFRRWGKEYSLSKIFLASKEL